MMTNKNIYERLNLLWTNAIIAEETDKIKNIEYEMDEKSTRSKQKSEIFFNLFEGSEETCFIHLLKIDVPDFSHIALFYNSAKAGVSFHMMGTSERVDIRPYDLFVNHTPFEISSLLEEVEVALYEANSYYISHWNNIEKFDKICENVLEGMKNPTAYYADEVEKEKDTYEELKKESKYIKVGEDIIEVRYVESDPGISYFSCVERMSDPDYENIYITYFNKDEEPIYFNIYDCNNNDWVALIGYNTLNKPENEIIEFTKKVVDTYRKGEWFNWERK